MACKDFEELILRDLDGEITNPDRNKLKDHLSGCPVCTKDRAHFGKIDEAVKKIPTPAPPRRDFASIAMEKAEASVAEAPRTVRKRVSATVWATVGIASVVAVIAIIGAAVYLSDRPVEILPPSKLHAAPGEPTKPDIVRTTEPEVRRDAGPRALTPEELKQIYPFGEKDAVAVLTDVNLQLISAETPARRIELLEKGVEAMLDGYAQAMAYQDATSAKQYAEGLSALLGQGLVPILDKFVDSKKEGFLRAMGDTYSDRANKLMRFSQELPFNLRFQVETVIGSCNKARDAARAAAKKR